MSDDRSPRLDLSVQYASSSASDLPAQPQLLQWAQAALAMNDKNREMVIRVVDVAEIHDLNLRYRGKDKATNVLSFQSETLPDLDDAHLGDLVICASVVASEALQQGKTVQAHWAHLVIHGVLHLRGFDHQTDQQADEMEKIEIQILERMGIANPYLQTPLTSHIEKHR